MIMSRWVSSGLLSSYSDSTPDINNRVANSPSAGNNIKRAEITLSELSALYKNADEADDVARPDITRVNSSNNLENSSIEKIVVKMRNKGNNNRDDSRSPSKRKPKIINRLSCEYSLSTGNTDKPVDKVTSCLPQQ